MLYSIVGILVIILDQAVKFWVSDTLFGTDVVRFIPGVISLVNVHNDGAAFSFLSGQGARIYFIIATGVFVLLVVIALATNFIRGKFSRWCLVFVAAGGLGNMIDRIIYGYVQDMFKVELFNFAIFNVADVFITVFAILFALSMFFEKPETDLIDVLYERDDEDDAPKKEKLPRRARKAAKLAAEGEAAAEPPAVETEKKGSVRAARKSRQEKYEQEYEEYKAQQRAAMNRKAAAQPVPAAQPDAFDNLQAAQRAKNNSAPDPFDAWENAKVKAEANEKNSYAGRLMDTPKAPASRPAAPAPQPAARPKAEAPAPQPAPKPAPAPAPQPAPAPAAAEEYSLDDILAEFK